MYTVTQPASPNYSFVYSMLSRHISMAYAYSTHEDWNLVVDELNECMKIIRQLETTNVVIPSSK